MITPTSKKLSRKQQYLAVDKDGIKYKPIFEDEEFYQVKGIVFLFVSQYGRLIRTYKKAVPRLLNPYYNPSSGYTNVVLTTPTKKIKRTSEGLHELVASVWCEYPTFLKDKELPKQEDKEVIIHHLKKVKKNLDCNSIDVNFAINLFPVYQRYHGAIEDIRNIKFLHNGSWIRCDIRQFDSIADKWDISLFELYELIHNNPTYIENGLEYYKLSDTKIMEIRKYKSSKAKPKKKKKSKKK